MYTTEADPPVLTLCADHYLVSVLFRECILKGQIIHAIETGSYSTDRKLYRHFLKERERKRERERERDARKKIA